jgi:hypothetical protein
MEAKTVNGILQIDPPTGYTPGATTIVFEGELPPYKGFRAGYYLAKGQPGEDYRYYGHDLNLNHRTGFPIRGNTMEELTLDFHLAVDEFLSELSNPAYPSSKYGIEYYTDDPNILDYYNRHRGIFNLETMINIHKAVLKLETV